MSLSQVAITGHHEGHQQAKGPVAVASARDGYATLPLYRYRAVLRPRRELILTGERMNAALRGAFGTTLRRLVCHDLKLACARCPQRKSCAYPAVFDPGAVVDEPTLEGSSNPPRPFVVRPARATVSERIAAGAELALDLHVVGTAQRQARYLLAALARLANEGLGPTRVPLELERVDALDARGAPRVVAVDGPKMVMRPGAALALRAGELAKRGDATPAVVHVRFLTPTLLRQGGEAADAPAAAFGVLVRRLQARLGALATLFGDGPFGDDPRALAAAADCIEMRPVDAHVARDERRSDDTNEGPSAVRGLVGEARYLGDLGPFMPLLRLGELLHVGKHASFGLGRIQVEVRSTPMSQSESMSQPG